MDGAQTCRITFSTKLSLIWWSSRWAIVLRSDGCLEGGQRLIDYRLPAAQRGPLCTLHSVHRVPAASCTVEQGLLWTLHSVHCRDRVPAISCTVEQGLLCTLHSVHRVPPAQPRKAYYAPSTAEQGLAFTETRQVGSRTIFTEVLCTQAQQSPG